MRAPEDDVRESGRGLGDGRRRPGRRAAGLTSGPDQRTRPGVAVAASCLSFVAAAFAAFFAAVELPALAPPVLSAVLAARPAVRDWLAVAPS